MLLFFAINLNSLSDGFSILYIKKKILYTFVYFQHCTMTASLDDIPFRWLSLEQLYGANS